MSDDERFFEVILSTGQYDALVAAAELAVEVWDGRESDDLAQQDDVRAALVALANAAEVR